MLEKADYLRRLDGSYSFDAEGDGTRVGYVLYVDVSLPLPGGNRSSANPWRVRSGSTVLTLTSPSVAISDPAPV